VRAGVRACEKVPKKMECALLFYRSRNKQKGGCRVVHSFCFLLMYSNSHTPMFDGPQKKKVPIISSFRINLPHIQLPYHLPHIQLPYPGHTSSFHIDLSQVKTNKFCENKDNCRLKFCVCLLYLRHRNCVNLEHPTFIPFLGPSLALGDLQGPNSLDHS
jgi:hypothetical protein